MYMMIVINGGINLRYLPRQNFMLRKMVLFTIERKHAERIFRI